MGQVSTERASLDERQKLNSQMEYKSKTFFKPSKETKGGETDRRHPFSSFLFIYKTDYFEIMFRVTFAVYLLVDQFYSFWIIFSVWGNF